MDKQFLEFWGNLLRATAQGQRQLDDFGGWLSRGMRGFSDLTAIFQKSYGLANRGPDMESDWKKACTSFEAGFRAYLDALGCVPKSDYMALQTQLQELTQKTEEQEAALRGLRQELGASRMAQGDVVRGFQDLIQVQSDQFRELTESLGRLVSGR